MSSPSPSTLAALPSLAPFVHRLSSYLDSGAPPSTLFIHAPSNSHLLPPLLLHLLTSLSPPLSSPPTIQELLPKHVVVDLEEVHTTRIAFDSIANTLSGWNEGQEWDEGSGRVQTWDGIGEGLKVVKSRKRVRKVLKGKGKAKKVRREEDDYSEDEGVDAASEEEQSEVEDEETTAWSLAWKRKEKTAPRELVGQLRDSFEHLQGHLESIFALGTVDDEDTPAKRQRRWIIFNHGEMLPDLAAPGNLGGAPRETGMGMTFTSSIHRLSALTFLPISTITISRFPWTKSREGMVGLATPTLVSFPSISATDLADLLSSRFASASPTSRTLDTRQLVDLFRSLVGVIHKSFASQIEGDIDELAYLVAKFWPKWLSSVENSNPPIPSTDTARLTAQLKSDLQLESQIFGTPRNSQPLPVSASAPAPIPVLQGFTGSMPALPSASVLLDPSTPPPTPHSRSLAAIQFAPILSSANLSTVSPTKAANVAADQSLAKSLPELSKWLLLASFYAGFNPPKTDVRNFVKVDEGIAKKGKKGKKATVKKPGTTIKASVRSELGGGKAFPLERLLAIFQAILGPSQESFKHTIDVLALVTTLINLQLLQRVSGADKILDGVKLKCKLTRETVQVLAISIGKTDWVDFLWDTDR